jgi:hypothetical protein
MLLVGLRKGAAVRHVSHVVARVYVQMRAFIPILIRFVKAEDAMLSATKGGARLYMNMDDYDSYRTPGE